MVTKKRRRRQIARAAAARQLTRRSARDRRRRRVQQVVTAVLVVLLLVGLVAWIVTHTREDAPASAPAASNFAFDLDSHSGSWSVEVAR